MRRLSSALLATLLLLTASGCFDPCDTLADRICECEPTELATLQCKQRVEVQKEQHKPTDADRSACEAALETCTCDALEQRKLSACGYAR